MIMTAVYAQLLNATLSATGVYGHRIEHITDSRIGQIPRGCQEDQAECYDPVLLPSTTEKRTQLREESVRYEIEEKAETEHLKVRKSAKRQRHCRIEAELKEHLEYAHAGDDARKEEEQHWRISTACAF